MNKYQKAKSKIVEITIKSLALDGVEISDRGRKLLKRDLGEFVKDRSKFHNVDSFKYVLYQKKICKKQYQEEIERYMTRG